MSNETETLDQSHIIAVANSVSRCASEIAALPASYRTRAVEALVALVLPEEESVFERVLAHHEIWAPLVTAWVSMVTPQGGASQPPPPPPPEAYPHPHRT